MTKYECDRCGKDAGFPKKVTVTHNVKSIEISNGSTCFSWPTVTKELDLCDDCNKATLEFLKVEAQGESSDT